MVIITADDADKADKTLLSSFQVYSINTEEAQIPVLVPRLRWPASGLPSRSFDKILDSLSGEGKKKKKKKKKKKTSAALKQHHQRPPAPWDRASANC